MTRADDKPTQANGRAQPTRLMSTNARLARLPVQENILRLDIAMYVVLVVEVTQSPQNLPNDEVGGAREQRPQQKQEEVWDYDGLRKMRSNVSRAQNMPLRALGASCRTARGRIGLSPRMKSRISPCVSFQFRWYRDARATWEKNEGQFYEVCPQTCKVIAAMRSSPYSMPRQPCMTSPRLPRSMYSSTTWMLPSFRKGIRRRPHESPTR